MIDEEKWHQTISFKVLVIGFLALVLLIPLGMVKSIIREREVTDEQVELEIMERWGGQQLISGPTMHVPVYYKVKGKDDEFNVLRKWLHIMPEELVVTGNVETHLRKRGIYETPVYDASLAISGRFSKLDEVFCDADEIDWEGAYITFSVSDNRGIKGKVLIDWDGNEVEPEAGLITHDLSASGMSLHTVIDPQSLAKERLFELRLNLSGSKSLLFNPLGKKSSVSLQSDWKDPSFTGSFLPTTREVNEDGFFANWTITHLNRNFPQNWVGNRHKINEQQLGVELFVPVNHYQKSLRSAKYGILIICLTLLVFLFIELVKKKTIQILQYLLVGLALVLFFSILTALSEHMDFALAYLIACTAIIVMVTLYSYGILGDRQQALWVFLILSVLYMFLFVLLQLNDFAFLAGNIGLFLALGFIMKASSKIKNTIFNKNH